MENPEVKKILVLGSQGMAGHVALEHLRRHEDWTVSGCARNAGPGEIEFEATDFVGIENIICRETPNVVINCIGMLVAACQSRPAQAILINSYLPNYLSVLGRKYNFRLIHISTDCVFSGSKGNYHDNDFRDGDTPYARTKTLGEVINDTDLTIRTSIIGPELKQNGTGLFHWFMQQHGKIKGYSKAYWSGVTTIELAKALTAAIEQDLTGLYQLTMPEKISKYDLLKLFKDIWLRDDIQVESYDGYFCDKSMISDRQDFKYTLPVSYRQMFEEMKCWMIANTGIYPYCSVNDLWLH